MKTNIYQKMHSASCQAKGVAKGKKVQGMHFNPLLHDDVQAVAMEALLDNNLYPEWTYENEIKDNFVFIICNMKIYDIENPSSFMEFKGCSAMGQLDKFGTGNAMSYSKKYAFLNALNLKTGLDSDNGYKAEPFKSTKESQAKASGGAVETQQEAGDNSISIEDMKNSFASAQHIPRLRYLKKVYEPQLNYLLKNSLRDYRQVTDIFETREQQLNSHK